jgi:acetyl-CoA acyltransferase
MRMEKIYVAGVGMTPFRRHPDLSVKQLAAWAIRDALADAGCEVSAIDAVYFGTTGQGFFDAQLMVPGQMAVLPLGIQGIPIFNVENACATASAAFHLGCQNLRAGSAQIVLVVGVDKIHSASKEKNMAFFDGAWDVETVEENVRKLMLLGEGVQVPLDCGPERAHSRFMDVYAAFSRNHVRRFGLTQRQLAIVAAKNHTHAVNNDRAQYRNAMTTEDVMAAPLITWPLTLPMCAPISDGAAAAVLCTQGAFAKSALDRKRRVRVLSSVFRSATGRSGDDAKNSACHLAAMKAYEEAGVGPESMSVAEVHDATSMGEIIQSENLGLCEFGAGGALAQSGATTLGGRVPINPSGGLASKGHPVGATGLGQIFELVSQLRGEAGKRQVENARFAVQENGGGLWGIEEAAAHVGVFSNID